jgi:hypothetical protein
VEKSAKCSNEYDWAASAAYVLIGNVNGSYS